MNHFVFHENLFYKKKKGVWAPADKKYPRQYFSLTKMSFQTQSKYICSES